MPAICKVCGKPIGLGAVSGCCSKKCHHYNLSQKRKRNNKKWGLWKKVKATMMTIFILLAAYAVVVMVSGLAKASHETYILLGQFGIVNSMIVCDEKQQVKNLHDAYNEGGQDLAMKLLKKLREEGTRCSRVDIVFMTTAKVGEKLLQYGNEQEVTVNLIRIVVIGIPINRYPYVHFFDRPEVQFSWTMHKLYTYKEHEKHLEEVEAELKKLKSETAI